MLFPDIDFSHLKAVNPRTLGWIRLKNSLLDYPVVEGNGDFYLTHNFSDEPSPHGCIYASFDSTFPGSRCCLYGHNMKDGTMFTALIFYYYQEGYFASHKKIELLTENALYTISVFAAIQFPDDCAFMQFVPETQEPFSAWKEAVLKLSPFSAEFDLHVTDSIVSLVTCRRMDVHPTPGNLLVVGKLEAKCPRPYSFLS